MYIHTYTVPNEPKVITSRYPPFIKKRRSHIYCTLYTQAGTAHDVCESNNCSTEHASKTCRQPAIFHEYCCMSLLSTYEYLSLLYLSLSLSSLTLLLADHAHRNAQPAPRFSFALRVLHNVRPHVVRLNDNRSGRSRRVGPESLGGEGAHSSVHDQHAACVVYRYIWWV